MHLIETYALNCGLKIDKPYIYQKYCPVPFEKYISFQPYSKYDAKSYDYWQEVIDQLFFKLQEHNIHIVQIGGKDEKPIQNCYHLQGKTSIGQAAYLINKGILHLGVDSFGVHIASHFDKKIVCLYSNSRPENAGPYFSSKENIKIFEVDRSRKPSYSAVENPKTINKINPADIANSVLEYLNLESNKIKTIFLGENYNRTLIESVPNQVIENISQFGIESLIIRMDYEFNERNLAEQLKRNRCSIITDKKIDYNILNTFKGNIDQIIYNIDENHDVEFAKNLKKLARPFILSTFLNENFVNSLKLSYLDVAQIMVNPKTCKNDLKLNLNNLNDIYYKSNKYTLSNGNTYNSKAAYKLNIPFQGKPIKIIDHEDFWEEAKHLYIFELTKD
jgi:hypothetical protein